jgi:hypothetical protein
MIIIRMNIEKPMVSIIGKNLLRMDMKCVRLSEDL